MARIRTIKPEFPQSESMGRVSREARLCFVLLWTQADDAGRLRGNSRMLASLLYPYDDDAPRLMDGWLSELSAEGCIRRYTVDGNQFVDIPHWLQHQKLDHPSKSKFPEFVDTVSQSLASPRENSLGPRIKDQGPRRGPRMGPHKGQIRICPRGSKAKSRWRSKPGTSSSHGFLECLRSKG